jgi:hypothetical protein
VLESPSAYKEAKPGDSGLAPIKLTHSSIKNAIIESEKQMKRILKEADLVAQKPALAMDENHKPEFLSSEDFKAVMPVYVVVPNPTSLYPPSIPFAYNPVERDYLIKHSNLGAYYMFSERVGSIKGGGFASNLTGLPTPPKLPIRIYVYMREGYIRGFSVEYSGPVCALAVGRVEGEKRELVLEEGEKVVKVETVSGVCWPVKRIRVVVWVRFVTNTGRKVEVGRIQGDEQESVELSGGGWLAGFWGWYGGAVDSFGVIWAR